MVSRITAAELSERLDDDSFTLVDTRSEDSFESWHIRAAENVPYDPTEGFEDEHRQRVETMADGDPVVVICGKGLTSTPFGIHLEDSGYDDVTVVRGGMEAYSSVQTPVEISTDEVLVYQIQRPATGCLGYLIASDVSGNAVVVDPTRHTDQFAVLAQKADLTVTAVVDTHVHADHLSGGPELADELDVPYYLGAVSTDEHAYDSLAEEESIEFGGVTVRALHTPGHTREIANLLVDEEFLLTSDTLFVDSVGRTELGFEDDSAERGAELLYESLHEVLLERDDDFTVLPGHVSITDDIRYEAGSPGDPIRARLGDLTEDLDLLGLDREAFVDRVTDDLPDKPSEYETVIDINAGEASVDSEERADELDTGPNNCSA